MHQKKYRLAEEDKADLETAIAMLLPWIILLILGGIFAFYSPKKGSKNYSKEVQELKELKETIDTYQFEWPTGVVEIIDQDHIIDWKFYPETHYLEIITDKVERDRQGISNVSYGVYDIEVKNGIAHIKAGCDW